MIARCWKCRKEKKMRSCNCEGGFLSGMETCTVTYSSAHKQDFKVLFIKLTNVPFRLRPHEAEPEDRYTEYGVHRHHGRKEEGGETGWPASCRPSRRLPPPGGEIHGNSEDRIWVEYLNSARLLPLCLSEYDVHVAFTFSQLSTTSRRQKKTLALLVCILHFDTKGGREIAHLPLHDVSYYSFEPSACKTLGIGLMFCWLDILRLLKLNWSKTIGIFYRWLNLNGILPIRGHGGGEFPPPEPFSYLVTYEFFGCPHPRPSTPRPCTAWMLG